MRGSTPGGSSICVMCGCCGRECVCVVGRVGYMAQCVCEVQAQAAGLAVCWCAADWWAWARHLLSLVATWFLYRGVHVLLARVTCRVLFCHRCSTPCHPLDPLLQRFWSDAAKPCGILTLSVCLLYCGVGRAYTPQPRRELSILE